MVLPGVVALMAFIAFIGVGTWQLERKVWKETLIDTLEHRLVADPVPIPPPQQWPSFTPEQDEFRRVSLSVTFQPETDALVYTIGSTLRGDVSGPGYWVFAPAKLANGATVVLNRGFVPEGQQDSSVLRALAGSVPIVGVMRWPERRSWFTPNDNPSHNLWFVRDQLSMARSKDWGEVAPFYIELETPSGYGDLPRYGRLTINLPNNHLQYALTWFGLAAVIAIGFAFWLRSQRRDRAIAAQLVDY